jgi:hypothetical protein
MNNPIRTLAVTAGLLVALPALPHHSDAGVDMSKLVSFQGTVKEFVWKNPHVYFLVSSQRNGQPVTWEVQMANLSGLARKGWTPETLKAGDKVTVRAHPAADGRTYGIVETVEKEGGLTLAPAVNTPAVTPPAKSIAGRWLTDPASVTDEPKGGFDGFFRASLALNDKAKAAQAAYTPMSADNPEATCVGRPTPAALLSSRGYLLEFEIKEQEKLILFRSEWFNEVRTIYMDGRKHPDPSVRFTTGHSIGHWEGDTLVVDTTNFADHRSPYQIGVPSGGKKHVVEKYRLTKDGTHIDAEFTLEDPEYLAKPLYNHRQLVHSPHLKMYFSECDLAATSRFLGKK